jgi:hypothetical protein
LYLHAEEAVSMTLAHSKAYHRALGSAAIDQFQHGVIAAGTRRWRVPKTFGLGSIDDQVLPGLVGQVPAK